MALVLHAIDQLGVTQRDLARILGVEKTTIFRWKSGQFKVHPCAVRILGMALEVPGALTWLLNTTEVVTGKRPALRRIEPEEEAPYVDRTAPWNQ